MTEELDTSSLDPARVQEVAARLDWVRPIAGFMRLQGVPEAVVQSTMAYLLSQLDAHLDGAHHG